MLGFKRLGFAGVLLLVVSAGNSLIVSAQQLDPTRPPQQAGQALPAQQPLQLTMIQSQVAEPWALVNGQRVRVGDTVAGYQVMQVGAASVLLQPIQAQPGTTAAVTLTLFPAIKQPSEQGG